MSRAQRPDEVAGEYVEDERPVCQHCGEVARNVFGIASVRAELNPDRSVGKLLSVRKFSEDVQYECGGGHMWTLSSVDEISAE